MPIAVVDSEEAFRAHFSVCVQHPLNLWSKVPGYQSMTRARCAGAWCGVLRLCSGPRITILYPNEPIMASQPGAVGLGGGRCPQYESIKMRDSHTSYNNLSVAAPR
jgi:hypothetical protein